MNIGATGHAGEDAALEAYEKEGFELVTRNYQTRWGEIDLIVKNETYLVFAEVKTRTPQSSIRGAYAMSRAKKQKVFKTALTYLQTFDLVRQPRFDVVDILGHWTIWEGQEIFVADQVHIIKGAFGSEVYDGFI